MLSVEDDQKSKITLGDLICRRVSYPTVTSDFHPPLCGLDCSCMRPSKVEVRRIDPSLLPPIRHAVLWPSVAIESQLQPFDHADTTIHYGAFVPENEVPIGCITLTKEEYKKQLPPAIAGKIQAQYQVHKFAVLQEYQSRGIGSVLFRHVLEHLQQLEAQPILLHLDARVEQKA